MKRSRRELFYKKGVLKKFAKFTGKHLHQSLFVNKVAGPRPNRPNRFFYRTPGRQAES